MRLEEGKPHVPSLVADKEDEVMKLFKKGIPVLIVLLLASILLAVTKPSKDKHADALAQNAEQEMGAKRGPGRLLGKMAAVGASAFARTAMDYHDYVLFSTMTLDGEIESVGVLGLVVKTGK